jgi:hypothetical protein
MADMVKSGTSAIRRWYEGMTSATASRAKGHAIEGAHAVRGLSEGLVTGSVLGALEAVSPTGLDLSMGPKGWNLPADLALGALAGAGAIAWTHDGIGSDLRNIGTTAIGIFGYRKTGDYIRKLQTKGGGSTMRGEGRYAFGGESVKEDDPIVETARKL